MPLGYAVAGAAAALTVLISSTAISLDQPNDDEATAAYRAMPAIAAQAGGKQQQILHVETCTPAKGRPGVECQAQLRLTPQARPQLVQTYFARGPDSAWVAELMP